MTPNSSGAVLNYDWWRNQRSVIANQTKWNIMKSQLPKKDMMFCCHVTMLQPWSYAETNAWKSQGKKQCFCSNGIKLFVPAFVMRLSKKNTSGASLMVLAAHHSNWAIMPKKARKLQYEWFVPRNESFFLDTNGLCKVREDYVAIKCFWVPWTDCSEVGTKRGRTIVNSNFKAWFLSPG